MQTIFIVISQSSITKNILRSGGFDLMKKKGYRLVIFFNCKRIPDYLIEEFGGENISLIAIPDNKWGVIKMHRLLMYFFHYFVWNKTTIRYFRYSQHYIHKHRAVTALHLVALRVISFVMGNVKFLRLFFRWVEYRVFPQKSHELTQYFKEYKPDLLFSSSVSSTMDSQFLKEAKRRGITTVTMPKTWDTLTMKYLRIMPDYFLVQNNILKERLVNLQDFPEDKVYVIGFPEFDWYARKNIIRSREEHFKKFGLDPELPLLFFGSQGRWYPKDYQIADLLYKWIKDDELIKPCQILVRPYFLQLSDNDPFLKYKNLSRAAYDDTYFQSDSFYDNWDPTNETIIDFVNTLYHSDVHIIILSTLALDGACFDKPIINTIFGCLYRKGIDITSRMTSIVHYDWIFDTNATSVARTSEELKNWVNEYLENPKIKSKERRVLRDRLCYKIDGKSSERMVDAIKEILD